MVDLLASLSKPACFCLINDFIYATILSTEKYPSILRSKNSDYQLIVSWNSENWLREKHSVGILDGSLACESHPKQEYLNGSTNAEEIFDVGSENA